MDYSLKTILILTLLLVVAPILFAENVYHVDARNGDDDNNGLSPGSAWKTIGHVNDNWSRFSPGDDLLLKRGETYGDESLWVKIGGTSSNYMVIGAYGSGNKPIISNSEGCIIAGSSDIGYIRIQDLHLRNTDNNASAIYFNKNGISNLVISGVEIDNVSGNGIMLRKIDTYTIESSDIHDCSNSGIAIIGSSSDAVRNGIIRNNVIYDTNSNDGITLHQDGEGNDIGSNHQILNNIVYNCAEQGLDITSGTDIIVRQNETFSNGDSGILVDHRARYVWIDKHFSHDEKLYGIIIGSSSNTKLTASIIYNAHYHALSFLECTDTEIYNNTIVSGPDSSGSIIDIGKGAKNIIVKNNIITSTVYDGPGRYVRYLGGVTPSNTKSQFNHNIWWRPDHAASDNRLWYDENRGLYDFETWQSQYGQDQSGSFSNPHLKNPEKNDFHLESYSPGIDQGTNVGLSADYENNRIYQGAGPEIGAFEYGGIPNPLSCSAVVSPASGQAPLTVSFSGSANGGSPSYKFKWNYGDGQSSDKQSPSHTYTDAGDFTAKLTVTDEAGREVSESLIIKVEQATSPLTASASASTTSGEAPLDVSFTGTVSGGISPYSFTWNFGDGNTSTAQNPSHVYSSAGDFTAVMTVTDNEGQKDDASIAIKVTAAPDPLKAFASASPTSGQAPLKVSFAGNVTGGTTPYTFRWDFGEGSTSSDRNPSHIFTEAKDFRVTLTAKDSQGSQDNASLTIQVTASSQSLEVTATGSPTSGQAPLYVSFGASVNGGTPPYMYTWNFGDGRTSNIQNPTHEFRSSGDFTVTLKVSDSAASAGASSAQALTSMMITVGDADKPIDFDCAPRQLLFGISVASGKVVEQSFNIIKTGSGELTWTVDDDAEWVTCLPSSGHDGGQVAVRVDSASLSPGLYNATISVSSPQAAQSPKYVVVKLKLTDDDKLPFGSFDTPVDGAAVSGNIPLAGWALDDISVDRVEIKRNACLEDSPEAIDSDGLVFMDHAVFVKGARPDIGTLYPDYPNINFAGWGCMLPTFRLPQRGNGYFTIYALAFDSSGQRSLLGQKLIFADNSNRKKPFGSLETPEQGETVSGGPYITSGWALTPPPKEIPRDGFTIGVYVDGVMAGHPAYNQGRDDITRSYPEYRNSDGPLGSLTIDVSKFKRGMHLIEWHVEDSDGEVDVIDSRFFEIKNGKLDTSSFSVTSASRYTEDTTGRLTVDIDGSPVFDVPELGRIELQLKANGGSKFLGWGEDMSRDLPIGSTLDSSIGTFVWSLGPGFIGEHTLHFAVAEGWTISKPIRIIVRIFPKQEFLRRGVQDGSRGSQRRNSYSP